jgi:serine/threonine protein phosphatase PrpC
VSLHPLFGRSPTKRIFSLCFQLCLVYEESGVRYAALTDRGKRERNEDAFIAARIGRYHLFAVADGLGGHASGNVASDLAVAILEETARSSLSGTEPSTLLELAFLRANAAVHTYNRQHHLNAGTTLSAAIVNESGRCWIGTVGDSRTYIITPVTLWHTRDQSYVQSLVDAGLITPDEAMRHPRKNILTQALGLNTHVTVDLDEREASGGTLVISSDGMHDFVPEPRIRNIAVRHEPDAACRMLIGAAKEAMSTDNITVIVAKV